ncbi:hypothetical protein CLPUN_42270 [Clostridium puniceum]|uniref:Uncharacterized protein n=1 Tax=Clostridium puniceum TaxID=29367 RepID=A0A1S8T8N3_9CLOT|nr:hypothetical protein [Clostridium puniceum]OOM73989.1 hypothetical protein CLPUN_42270 [Clostridium puniceum]
MLNFYLISIGLFYLSLMIFCIRYFVNKNKITLKKNEEKWFGLIMAIVISFLPVINICIAVYWIYASVLMDYEKYINIMNK